MLQITISKRAALIIGVAMLLVIPGVAAATHIFTDVGDGSTHAEGIEWVADAGVTTGCGDGTIYCPNDAVNRAQMGTFMCRLAGNCGVAPSVNADQVDGMDATDFLGATDQAVDSDTVDGFDAADLMGPDIHYAAVLGSTGSTCCGVNSGGISGERNSTGTYDITFPVDVEACAQMVTMIDTAGSTGYTVQSSRYAGPSTEFRVITTDASAVLTDVSFMVMAVC